MLKGSRLAASGLIVALAAFAATGCKRDGDDTTNVFGSDIFTTDNYPGDSVQDGNVADDQRAMSVSGQDFSGGLRYFANGDRCQAIVTYQVSSGQLYAHYYDGQWSPPVALRAVDAVTGSMQSGTVVAFVNPVDDAGDFAEDREGDAYIFWIATDTDDDAGGSDAANEVIFMTHFDVSESDEVGSNYGFQEFAARISDQDEAGESIQTIGLVSDGLCGEARWEDGFNSYSWGDPTTAIIFFWNQTENDGAGFDTTTYAVRLDPEESTDAEFPLTASSDFRVDIAEFGASDGGLDAEETIVSSEYASYNEFLFQRVVADDSGATDFNPFMGLSSNDDDDETIQYNRFDLAAGTVTSATSLNPGSTDATDTDENVHHFLQPDLDFTSARSIYGPDEGLGVIVIYTIALVEDANGSSGDVLDTVGILLAEIDPDTATLLSNTFVDAEDITVADRVAHNRIDTRISRNGDYIVAIWMERQADGGSDDLGAWASVYHTSRPDDDGVTTLLSIVDSLSAAFLVSTDVDGNDVNGLMFQDNLGYICGGQSDPDVMHFFYEIDDTVSGNDAFLVRITVDPSGETEAMTTSLFETFDEFEIDFGRFNDEGENMNSTDGGNDGGLVVAWREDISSVDDDDRMFAERTGLGAGFAEIGSAVTFRQATGNEEVHMIGTPRGSEIGEFNDADAEDDDERPHGFSNVHIIFREDESTEDSSNGNALRTRQVIADEDVAFADSFIPSVAGGTFESPFDLDLPFVDPTSSFDADVEGVAVEGDTVGLWFTEQQHLYYQEFGGDNDNDEVGWLHDDGQSNPILVDDDNDEELDDFELFGTRSCVCDDLACATVFWTKTYGSGGGGGQTIRLQVRVRE
jgi:hypothetical protein